MAQSAASACGPSNMVGSVHLADVQGVSREINPYDRNGMFVGAHTICRMFPSSLVPSFTQPAIVFQVRITDNQYFCSVPHLLLWLYPPPSNTLLPPLTLSALPKLLKPHPFLQTTRRISKIIDQEVIIQLTLVTNLTMDGIELCGNWDGVIFRLFGWLEITCESSYHESPRYAPSPPKLTSSSAQTAMLLSK